MQVMQLAQLITILGVFLVFVALMYRKKLNTMVGVPLLAIIIAVVAGLPLQAILSDVINDGALRLSNPIMTIIFGATLAEIVKRTGIVEVMIRNTAEFAGDRAGLVSVLLMLLIALLFSVLAGLGAIVMVGSIVFPILISLGISKRLAGCIFLVGLSLGGMLNLFNWSLYTEVLKLSQTDILHFVGAYLPVCLLVSIAFVLIELRREASTSFKLQIPVKTAQAAISPWCFATPIIPVVLIFALSAFKIPELVPYLKHVMPASAISALADFNLSIIAAMFIGIIFGVLTAPKNLGSKARLLTQSIFKGIEGAAPAIALMIGIGMLLKAVAHPKAQALLAPTIQALVPAGPTHYLIFFTLAAPLALYRGPLNIWGMGSGLVALLSQSGRMPPAAIMAALMAVGQIQGISDPTNTYNVWIANHLGVDVQTLMKRTLLYAWVMALFGLIIASRMYFI